MAEGSAPGTQHFLLSTSEKLRRSPRQRPATAVRTQRVLLYVVRDGAQDNPPKRTIRNRPAPNGPFTLPRAVRQLEFRDPVHTLLLRGLQLPRHGDPIPAPARNRAIVHNRDDARFFQVEQSRRDRFHRDRGESLLKCGYVVLVFAKGRFEQSRRDEDA